MEPELLRELVLGGRGRTWTLSRLPLLTCSAPTQGASAEGPLAGVATHAAQALSSSILKMRGSPWKDGMRTGAITRLGNLTAESTAPLMLDELTDDNPAIVREAARAIEKIPGLNVTVARIVEVAAKSGAAGMDAYGRAALVEIAMPSWRSWRR